MKKYLGFISLMIFSISIIICLQLYPQFDFYRNTFSFLGTIKETALIFNLTMIILGITFYIYLNYIIERYQLTGKNNLSLKVLIILVCLSMIMVGLIPLNLNRLLHDIFAFALFFGFALGIILFGLRISEKQRLFGNFNIGYGIFILLTFSLINKNLITNAFNQSVYLLLSAIWIIIIFINLEIKKSKFLLRKSFI